MITGSNNVIEFIRYNQTPFWHIKRSEKSDPVFSAKEGGDDVTEGLTLDESISRLQRCLDMLPSGTYFIEAWGSLAQKKSRNKDTFIINGSNIARENNNQISGLEETTLRIDSAVSIAIEKLESKYRTEKLEGRIKELENEKKELTSQIESWERRVLPKITPHLGSLIELFGFKMKPEYISGTEQGSENNSDAQKRLESAFEKWAKNESDCVLMVEKIAELSERDKSTYSMAKNMLCSNK